MEQSKTGLFANLALTTSLLTIGLIVFGAVVRVTDSGLGCGNEWPLCDGTIFPPLDNVTAWIEWLHRLFAALIGVMGLATLAVAVRAYRRQNRTVLYATVIAAILFVIQSALGAFVVIFDLPPTMVTMHLGTAMLLLAALLVAWVGASYVPKVAYPRDHVTLLGYVTAGLTLVIILTGALVRGSGATLACLDWPLCNGEILPAGQGDLQLIHMTHRYAVLGLGVTIGMLVWYTFRTRSDVYVRGLAIAVLGVYLAQALVGAMFVLTAAAALWGTVHVALSSLTWALLVCYCVVDTYNTRYAPVADQGEEQQAWNLQSGPHPNQG